MYRQTPSATKTATNKRHQLHKQQNPPAETHGTLLLNQKT